MKHLNLVDLTALALADIQSTKGTSRNIQGIKPTSGYMVSIKGHESKEKDIPMSRVYNYLLQHEAILSADIEKYLGAWLSNGLWYLDISINIQSLDEALKFARDNDQLAIWDVVAGDEIRLSDLPIDSNDLPEAYQKIINLARQQESYLLKLRERLEIRGIRYSDSNTYNFERAKLIGILDTLDILGIDRTEFNWIF